MLAAKQNLRVVSEPQAEESTNGGVLKKIPIGLIRPFKGQPRTVFLPEKLEGLSRSIKKVGQRACVKVRPIEDGHFKYELIDGECRWRACKAAGLAVVEAVVVVQEDPEKQFVESVALNLCRSDHTPLEMARALRRMINYFSSQNGGSESEAIQDAADVCGRSPAWADQHLRLLKLHSQVQKMVDSGEIPFQVAVSLSSLKPEIQYTIALRIVRDGLTFKQALNFVRSKKTSKTVAVGARLPSPTEDYLRIRAFLARLAESAEGILDMKFSRLVEVFSDRPDEDLHKTILLIEDRVTELNGLKGDLEEVLQKKKQPLQAAAA